MIELRLMSYSGNVREHIGGSAYRTVFQIISV